MGETLVSQLRFDLKKNIIRFVLKYIYIISHEKRYTSLAIFCVHIIKSQRINATYVPYIWYASIITWMQPYRWRNPEAIGLNILVNNSRKTQRNENRLQGLSLYCNDQFSLYITFNMANVYNL